MLKECDICKEESFLHYYKGLDNKIYAFCDECTSLIRLDENYDAEYYLSPNKIPKWWDWDTIEEITLVNPDEITFEEYFILNDEEREKNYKELSYYNKLRSIYCSLPTDFNKMDEKIKKKN